MHTKERKDIQDFYVVGVNYKKTDTCVRGLFAINPAQYEQILEVAPQCDLSSFFILSTCNRTEVYGFAQDAQQFVAMICDATAGDREIFNEMCYLKSGYEAIAHLYQVAAGLDSQILGDYEIQGQLKSSIKVAKLRGFIDPFMERLLNSVIQSAKAIKTNTALSGGTVSVSFAAVQYIKELLGDTAGKKLVLVGTGKIGRVTCRNLVDYLQTSDITLINRTEETATVLASELGLKWAPMSQLAAQLATADVILVSTNAETPIVLKQHLEGKGAKLVIDLSVPCNVDAAVRELPGVTSVDVDMLSRIKDETLQKRQAEVPKAKAIIEEHIAEFKEWHDMRRHVPVLKEVKSKLKDIQAGGMLLLPCNAAVNDEERIQKVINLLATRMRRNYTPGCHYIQAINEYIA